MRGDSVPSPRLGEDRTFGRYDQGVESQPAGPESRPVFTHDPWVQVFVDYPDGAANGYVRIVESHGVVGAVVLPLCADVHGVARVGLVRTHRHPIGEAVWELPRGFGEVGEDVRSVAVRELSEETGITVAPSALHDLGSIHPNSGLLTAEVRLFLAPVPADQLDTEPVDTAEVETFEWIELAVLLDKVRDNTIRDSFTLAVLLRGLLSGHLRATIA